MTALLALVFLVPIGLPLAQAQLPSAPAPDDSVGNFDTVPAPGQTDASQASGSVVSTVVAEGSVSILRDFAIASSSAASGSIEIFDTVDMPGFTPQSKIQGAGTSTLTVRGAASTLSITDSVNSLIVVKATGSADQTVTFTGPSGVTFAKQAGAGTDNLWEVRAQVSGQTSQVIGNLIIASETGEATAASTLASGSKIVLDSANKATATVKAGGQLIFRAHSDYGGKAEVKSYNEAVVSALGSGRLTSESTTEFSGGRQLIANANYFSAAKSSTDAQAESRVSSQLQPASAAARAAVSGGASMAYNLDYVNIPAQTASQVAVYLDGALATRANTPGEVNSNAASGKASYWATTAEGRVLALASTPDRSEAHQVTVAKVPDASVAATTLAQLDASLGVVSQVSGSYSLLGSLSAAGSGGSGEVAGNFNSFFASEAPGSPQVEEYTDVRSSTEVFSKIHFAAQAASTATSSVSAPSGPSPPAVQMDTSAAGQVVAQTTFTDSAVSAIVTQAKSATTAQFELSRGVSATAVSDSIVKISGAGGTVGYLIAAKADGSGPAPPSSKLDTSMTGKVTSQMSAGDAVIYRAAGEAAARANSDAIAGAIASGSVASELNVGLIANAIAAADVDYANTVDSRVLTSAAESHRGMIAIDVMSKASQTAAVVINADRPSLPAIEPSDIVVMVNGQATTQASSAQGALSASGQATSFVQTNVQGGSQIIVSLPNMAANAASRIDLESKLETDSKAKAAVDSFGQFKAGFGGAATGSIVSMVARPDSGVILDYTVVAKTTAEQSVAPASTKVFDAIAVGQSMSSASPSTPNSLKFTSATSIVEAFDTSQAVLKVTATAAMAANFDLAPNIAAAPAPSAPNVLLLTSSAQSQAEGAFGALILTRADGAGAVSGSNFDLSGSAAGQIGAQLGQGSQVIFKAFSGFEAELSPEEKVAQAKAIADGKIIGQVLFATDAASGATSSANVNYFSQTKAVTSVASEDKVEILVDSATSAGKSVIISLDRNTVSGLVEGRGELLIDGRSVGAAASYQEALSASSDKYYLIAGGSAEVGLEAIVSMSHFSTRTITLQSPTPPSIYLFTTIGLAVVVVAQAVIPRIRRMGKKW